VDGAADIIIVTIVVVLARAAHVGAVTEDMVISQTTCWDMIWTNKPRHQPRTVAGAADATTAAHACAPAAVDTHVEEDGMQFQKLPSALRIVDVAADVVDVAHIRAHTLVAEGAHVDDVDVAGA